MRAFIAAALAAVLPNIALAATVPALEVLEPQARVAGGLGPLQAMQMGCRVGPLTQATRRRIVDLAAHEWAAFGLQTVDESTTGGRLLPEGVLPDRLNPKLGPKVVTGGAPRLGIMEDEAAVRAAIGGFWSATPQGSRFIENQDAIWRAPGGDAAGWVQPWSAAFVSWVMCEAGLGEPAVFARSESHWTYVDQAIRARDDHDAGRPSSAAYAAYDLGEQDITPGDLLCASRAGERYRNLADRRAETGQGAPLHCDVVVGVDTDRGRILAIGGNVAQSVALTLTALRPAVRSGEPAPATDRDLAGGRRWFAHLKLQAPAIEVDALASAPDLQALEP